jgi:Zn finger protein HypA/HybF involved in hydrogenase expression
MKKAEILKLLKEANLTVEDLLQEENIYSCADCKQSFSSETKKRKCPHCKSKNISGQTKITQQVAVKNEPDFIHQTGGLKNIQSGKKQARTEAFQPKRTKHLKLGGSKEDTLEFDAKVKFTKTPRIRPPFKPTKIKCSTCNEVKEINPANLLGKDRDTWECQECLIKRIKR